MTASVLKQDPKKEEEKNCRFCLVLINSVLLTFYVFIKHKAVTVTVVLIYKSFVLYQAYYHIVYALKILSFERYISYFHIHT